MSKKGSEFSAIAVTVAAFLFVLVVAWHVLEIYYS